MKIIERSFYELLKGLAGGAVYMMRAPDKAAGPFLIVQRVDSDRSYDSINTAGGIAKAYIQVDAYHPKYYGAKTLSGQVEAILNKFRGVVNVTYLADDGSTVNEAQNIAGISLQNDVDIFDDTDQPYLFRNSNVFIVTYYQ